MSNEGERGGAGPAPEKKTRRGPFDRFLGTVEFLGNLLPHPVTLFAIFCLGIVVLSQVLAWFGLEVTDPRPEGARGRAADGIIRVRSLLDTEGVQYLFTSLVDNFASFPPLGTVLVALLGVGIAERSGLFSAGIRALVLNTPKRLITAVLVFAGIISNTASEMGYVVLVPLGAAIFHALGRHPLAGLAAAFAGVSGGYSANLLIGTIDPLLSGITQEAARMIDSDYELHPAINWYFMIGSVFLITILGTFVSEKIVEPRLGPYDPSRADDTVDQNPSMDPLKPIERRGLKLAGLTALLMAGLLVFLAGPRASVEVKAAPEATLAELVELYGAGALVPKDGTGALRPPDGSGLEPAEGEEYESFSLARTGGLGGAINGVTSRVPYYGVLRDVDTGGLIPSPFLRSIVAFILIVFVFPGLIYGRVVGTLKNDRDVIDAMAASMSSMGLYIVLVFFAAQFIAYFNHSNLGLILSVLGANGIREIGLDNPGVFLPFILACAFVNLMLGSASAQWALTAPVFVPMLMQTGYSPEVIQAAYRIGDSSTNIIAPMMSYFGLILAFAAKYDRKLGIGTLVAAMLPFSIVFLIGWVIFFYLWVFVLGIPVGPGAPVLYPAP